jgi:hypothetical protein
MWKMFAYARAHHVIPNLTFNGYGLNEINVPLLAKFCGGIAVSHYNSTDDCFAAIETLSVAGIKQVNIHKVLSQESLSSCYELLSFCSVDERAKNHLKAVVFLTLKPKGSRNCHNPIKDVSEYKKLIEHANALGVQMGMDSCSASMYLRAMKDSPHFDRFVEMVESCESLRFSFYCNVDGEFFPCSFTEGESGWERGLLVTESTDFMKDVWNHKRSVEWRNKNIENEDPTVCQGCIGCTTFPEIDPKNW